jgi:hypothetical protein
MYKGLKFIGTKELTREQIQGLIDDGFYVEYCDNGAKLLKVDIFVSKGE